jgi:hypothetical protein
MANRDINDISNRELQALFRNILATIDNEVRKEFQRSGTYPKTGKKYKKLPNRSAGPMESPATQTGNYHNSYKSEHNYNNLKLKIGNTAQYSKFLEYGTKYMEKREGYKKALSTVNLSDIVDSKLRAFFR